MASIKREIPDRAIHRWNLRYVRDMPFNMNEKSRQQKGEISFIFTSWKWRLSILVYLNQSSPPSLHSLSIPQVLRIRF